MYINLEKALFWLIVVVGCFLIGYFSVAAGIYVCSISNAPSVGTTLPFVKGVPIFIEKEFRVTAYCLCEECCGRFADGITASGYVIQEGDRFVAAPKEYPFGLMMEIPGYGIVPVEDRGGSIKGDRLDVFFYTHQEALDWGVQYLTVKIYLETAR